MLGLAWSAPKPVRFNVHLALSFGLGYLFHGGQPINVAHGFAFALLGLWFWVVFRRRGPWHAYFSGVLAHATWNGTLVILALAP